MRLLLFCLLVTNFSRVVIAQEDQWRLLADVTIEQRYDDLLLEERPFPVFGNRLKAYEGREVILNGYMVPLDELLSQKSFVISSLPFQTCFFCGGAGPETVAEVQTVDPVKYTDRKIQIKGKLRLNDSDPLKLYYTLDEAVILR